MKKRLQQEEVRKTFSGRSQNYECESSWMRDEQLMHPLIPDSTASHRGLMLDVCAGTGVVSEYAELHGMQALRLDISIDMLRRGKKRGRSSLLVGDGVQLPLRDECVDIVVCRQGLQYFDPESALREWLRVARKEIRLGHITMLSEADRSFWKNYFDLASPGRRSIFAPGEMAQLIAGVGGHIEKVIVRLDEGTLCGAIRHLGSRDQERVIGMFEQAPLQLREDYAMRRIEGGDYMYRQRWEFITILK